MKYGFVLLTQTAPSARNCGLMKVALAYRLKTLHSIGDPSQSLNNQTISGNQGICRQPLLQEMTENQ